MDLDRLLTEEGRRCAAWILRKAGIFNNVDVDPEEPRLEDEKLSDEEIEMFDYVESLLFADEYERAYGVAMRIVRDLMRRRRYKSALYVCQMIGDEILRTEILKEGLIYYESVGDFKNAMDFARLLGDTERYEIYKSLWEIYQRL